MSEKIFGEIQKTEELNELANNLRKSKEFGEIRLLCSENHISEEIAEEFIKGNRLLLAKAGHQEKKTAKTEQNTDIEQVVERIKAGLLLSMKSDLVTETHPDGVKLEYTVEDVRKKLEAELEIYRDGDSKYVVDKLIELCSTDKKLLNAIMLPHKSYDKAFQYFYDHSRNIGYKMPHGNMVYLDNDTAVRLSVEYFKCEDAVKERQKTEKKEQLKQKPQEKSIPEVPQKKQCKDKAKEAVKKVEKEKDLEKKKQDPKPKKNELEGQMSLFDL